MGGQFGLVMHPRKQEYAQEVFKLVGESCQVLSDDKENAIPIVLNITSDDAEAIINKIMIALPDHYFYNAPPAMLYDILGFIVKNFILFEVQEDVDDEFYAYDLINFIHSLSAAIGERYYANSFS